MDDRDGRAKLMPAEEPGGDGAVRLQLAQRLNSLIQEKALTQTAAAAIFGIPQPHVSELRHFKLSRFSSERLLRFITLLDRDVEIVIRPKEGPQTHGTVSVQLTA